MAENHRRARGTLGCSVIYDDALCNFPLLVLKYQVFICII